MSQATNCVMVRTVVDRAGELPKLAIALRILALSEDPVAGVAEVAKIIVNSSEFADRILRIANSPFYATRRKIENLRQALSLLGFNATVTLALTISFTSSVPDDWLETRPFWRRAALSALAARAFGECSGEEYSERYFQAGLLQDIGELVLDCAEPRIYASVCERAQSHTRLTALEVESFGYCHADVGARLLQTWGVPAVLSHAVLHSHDLDSSVRCEGLSPLDRAVALSGHFADFWLDSERFSEQRNELALLTKTLLDLDEDNFIRIQERIAELIPQYEDLFEVKLLSAQQIFEVLKLTKNQSPSPTASEFADIDSTETRGPAHPRLVETDCGVAGDRAEVRLQLLNRAQLMQLLSAELAGAMAGDWPLSIAAFSLDQYVSLCHCKGHDFADKLMKTVAHDYLLRQLRPTDFVAYLGNGTAILTLPGTTIDNAYGVMERLRISFPELKSKKTGEHLGLSASIGLDTYTNDVTYGSVMDGAAAFLERALQASYLARVAGGDNTVRYRPL